MQEFRNNRGQLIGWTQEMTTTREIWGYRAPGVLVGFYFLDTGLTFRSSGVRFGSGNLLAALIAEGIH